ncbi:MAG: hypothetical protein ACUVWZ_13070 [Anaerolineae bacterium]
MNKGYAVGFLIILLVVILGFYVALTGFISSREALRAEPTPVSATSAARATRSPATLLPSPTTTPPITPTLGIQVPVTTTWTPSLILTEPAIPTESLPPVPTSPPPEPTETLPPPTRPPTPVPAPSFPFRLAGPPTADPSYPTCCYILGSVRDAAGNGLEGIRIQAVNEWTPPVIAMSKGGVDLGKYDIPIGRDRITWYVHLIDSAGNQISTKAQIQFDPNIANAFRVDWQRTF